jgi:hypothetical protein
LPCLTSSYNVVLTTGIDSRVGWSLISFLFEINFTVKKSNPTTKPHDSPQGCTVRSRKGAWHCSLGRGRGEITLSNLTCYYCKPASWISYSKTAIKFSAWQNL